MDERSRPEVVQMTEQEIRDYVRERLEVITAKVNENKPRPSTGDLEERKFRILMALHKGMRKDC